MAADGVLFLCVANSARSQLAECLARAMGLRCWSAGSAPGTINPLAIRALEEMGLSTEGQRSKGLDDVPLDEIGTVVTLCAEEVCPFLPGNVRRLHWPLPDPAAASGGDEEVLAAFREARDEIRRRLAGMLRSGQA